MLSLLIETTMNKFLIGLLILINPIILSAHYPLSAKYYFEASDEISILNIYLSQDGLERAMIAQYSVDEINSLSTAEYKELIVGYVRGNFNLEVDGKAVELLEGGIKLSDHQTDLKFIASPIKRDFVELDIDITAFSENEGHQTIFSYDLFGTSDKVILSAKNNFKSSIAQGTQKPEAGFLWLFGGIGLAILLAVFFWQKASRTKDVDLAFT